VINSSDGQKYTIHRLQYTLTAVYTFTDIKSRGQMMKEILVDISSPPSGKISTFNAYVALLRSKGRKHICLLRDFDESLLNTHCSIDLEAETDRLEYPDAQTKKRFDESSRSKAPT
jgi:hypothetical protein